MDGASQGGALRETNTEAPLNKEGLSSLPTILLHRIRMKKKNIGYCPGSFCGEP